MGRNMSNGQAGVLVILVAAGLLFGCAADTPEVSFRDGVRPILDAQCTECHMPGAPGHAASGLLMDSYAGLMRGTKFGRIVIPGDALTSILVMLIEGRADASLQMPHGRSPLSAEEIAVIRTWVEQGAKNN